MLIFSAIGHFSASFCSCLRDKKKGIHRSTQSSEEPDYLEVSSYQISCPVRRTYWSLEKKDQRRRGERGCFWTVGRTDAWFSDGEESTLCCVGPGSAKAPSAGITLDHARTHHSQHCHNPNIDSNNHKSEDKIVMTNTIIIIIINNINNNNHVFILHVLLLLHRFHVPQGCRGIGVVLQSQDCARCSAPNFLTGAAQCLCLGVDN